VDVRDPSASAATGKRQAARPERWDALLAWAIEAGRFGVVLLDGDGRVMHANQPACDLLGCDETSLVGRSIADLVKADDRGWLRMELELLLAGAIGRVRQEVRLITARCGEAWSELHVRLVSDVQDGSVCAIAMLEDTRDRPLRERELRRLAETDPLTALLNRRRFAAELDWHLAWTARYGARGALLVVDIDRLKAINDTHGRLAGDHAIISIANVIRSHSRSSDVTARVGGDEFAVLLPAATGEQAVAVAVALLNATTASKADGGAEPVTVSIGIAPVSEVTDAAGLFQRADSAMYKVKRSGGNGYAIEPATLGPMDPNIGAGQTLLAPVGT
jgi:diguanylate cyclase (GGDEF)-like protein/PAS domain S-box-containing protein